MAVSKLIPTESQRASAQCHLSNRDEWIAYRSNGVRYYAITSATSGRIYHVRADGAGCDCPAYQVWGYSACSHMLAVREAAHHDAMQEWLDDQTDDLLAEYDAQQAYRGYQAALTLARLGGFCVERGCQNDSARGSDFCEDHDLRDVA
jgi:hypothetical protein